MNRSVDVARARALFGDEQLGWVVDRLWSRFARGFVPSGRLRLDEPTDAQREAVERLVGRRPTTARSVSIEVAELERVVAHAGIATDLRALVEALRGPVVDRAALAAAERGRWAQLHAELRAEVVRIDPVLSGWVDELERTGLVRRLARDPEAADGLVAAAVAVLSRLPASAVPLSQLAASTLGDGHGLDDGRPTSTLVLGAIEVLHGLPRRDRSAAERRALWARAGVLLDELSAPALVLGLRPAGEGLLARSMRDHADVGEPCRVTLRQLVRHPVDWSSLHGRVSICENPAVVAAAAAEHGAGCAPLLCTEGQPSGAVQTLLRQLADAGSRLRFHADFDGGGIRIGNLLVDRFGASPWRMGREDYEVAVARGHGGPLRSQPGEASWDGELTAAMIEQHTAVHEEAIVDVLLADLQQVV